MDSVVSELARELAAAIATAVSDNPQVEACRVKAREAGYELKVSLDASVAFGRIVAAGAAPQPAGERRPTPKAAPEITNGDRRFLKSLRIAADETVENKEVE